MEIFSHFFFGQIQRNIISSTNLHEEDSPERRLFRKSETRGEKLHTERERDSRNSTRDCLAEQKKSYHIL